MKNHLYRIESPLADIQCLHLESIQNCVFQKAFIVFIHQQEDLSRDKEDFGKCPVHQNHLKTTTHTPFTMITLLSQEDVLQQGSVTPVENTS